MSLYDKPVRLLMKDMVADRDFQPGEILIKNDVRAWFKKKYPKIKDGTINAHLIRMSTNANSRVHYNLKPGDDDIFYQIDPGKFRLYEPDKDPAPIYKKEDPAEASAQEIEEELTAPGTAEFAYEKDLQNYLARNLSLIEPDLMLFEDDGINGVEFPVGGRFIDILAVDDNGNYVVIELKVSKGYDRVVGQLLRYMAWIRKHHAEDGQSVRGVIIAREISEDLKLACSNMPGVGLFEYKLSVSLSKAPSD